MPATVTPETTTYLILGLVVTSTIIVLFIASMVIRYRNLQKDLQMLQDLDDGK